VICPQWHPPVTFIVFSVQTHFAARNRHSIIVAVYWSITRAHPHDERVAAAMTASLAPQLRFQVNEPRVVGSPIHQTGMVDDRPMPADRAGRFD
jgi:hypothetical protein